MVVDGQPKVSGVLDGELCGQTGLTGGRSVHATFEQLLDLTVVAPPALQVDTSELDVKHLWVCPESQRFITTRA